jgi:hypothetical protein
VGAAAAVAGYAAVLWLSGELRGAQLRGLLVSLRAGTA